MKRTIVGSVLLFLGIMFGTAGLEAAEGHSYTVRLGYWRADIPEELEHHDRLFFVDSNIPTGTYIFEQTLSSNPAPGLNFGIGGIYSYPQHFELKYGLDYSYADVTLDYTFSKWVGSIEDWELIRYSQGTTGPFHLVGLNLGIYYKLFSAHKSALNPFIGYKVLIDFRFPQIEDVTYLNETIMDQGTDSGRNQYYAFEIGVHYALSELSRLSVSIQSKADFSTDFPFNGYLVLVGFDRAL